MSFSGQSLAQDPAELAAMIRVFRAERVRSFLEVGSRHGDTFHAVMVSLPRGAVGVCVDLPGNVWGSSSSVKNLDRVCADLKARGYRIKRILGDSTDGQVVERVRRFGPFDACLIDGDHRYAGAMADWQNFRSMSRLVAFHDIDGEGQRNSPGVPVEVPRVWREVRGEKFAEFVTPGSKMGIGIIWTI